jgi:nitrate/TMAO reductase-like tetraheme cytochrome c subunit
MKYTFLIIGFVAMVAACKSTKTAAVTTPTPTTPVATAKASNNMVPGDEQLKAIQARYPDVTMKTLTDGHDLYTQGACINCHGAKNIYSRSEEKWPAIIENMAHKAKITDEQKDAVLKYVLAMKAVQPTNAK